MTKKKIMKKIISFLFAITLSLTITENVRAHVNLDSPGINETFIAGDIVTISWSIAVAHEQENWDLYYSSDGGANWETIELDLPVSQLEYEWTVPGNETVNGQIKIVMDNTGMDYEDVSSAFEVLLSIPTANDNVINDQDFFESIINYPNPFYLTTSFEFFLPEKEHVTLEIYNVAGRKVAVLVNDYLEPGKFSLTWDASGYARGSYIYKIHAGNNIKTGKLLRQE